MDVEKAKVTLTHPRLLITAMSLMALHAGIWTTVYTPKYIPIPYVWAVWGLLAGLCGLLAVWKPSPLTVVAAGAMLVMNAAVRGMILVVAVLLPSLPHELEVNATFLISAAQWWTLMYVTLVVWLRMAIPWVAAIEVSEGA